MANPGIKAKAVKMEAAGPRTVREYLGHAVRGFERARLAYGHGTDNARDEAAFMILEALHLPIDQLEPVLDVPLSSAQRRRIGKLIAARISTRKPASYLLRRAYIQGVPFYVDERTIVPRSFIGELLHSGAVVGAPTSLIADRAKIGRVLDLCTGSGCLAVLAARAFPRARVDAADLSRAALAVAKRNVAASPNKTRIELLAGDLFAAVKKRRYDLIMANPPYVDGKAMARLPAEYRHEPKMALAGGSDGLDIVRRIVDEAIDHLRPGGALLCEIGRGRARLERAYPGHDFQWLDTEHSTGEVFWISERALREAAKP